MEVQSVRRADEALQETHREQTFQVSSLSQGFLQERPSRPPYEETLRDQSQGSAKILSSTIINFHIIQLESFNQNKTVKLLLAIY